MKIAIDISQVVYGTGVSVYTAELVAALLQNDMKNEYILFGGSLRRQSELISFAHSLNKPVKTAFFPFSPGMADLVWNKFHTLPIERFVGNIDVVHTSDWSEPPTNQAHKITTIHDLAPFKYPTETHPKIRAVHERKLAHARREDRFFIVPSKTTQQDLAEMGFDETKIKVIYEAASTRLKKLNEKESVVVTAQLGISKPFLLAVGTAPRKNNQRLIEAFRKSNLKDYHLVIVGTGQSTDKKVIFTGHITDHELSALYTEASALIYPSLYEGFGLPILDAFTFGVPVVTSNVGSMKEIAGGAAILVDPLEVESISKGIEEALTSKKSLIAKGLSRASDFSWQKAALETIKLYEQTNR